jgi:hypothetical protein
VGADVAVPDLRVVRLWREDVSAGAVATQPPVWTFLDFEAPEEEAEAEAVASAIAAALLADGGWYADVRTENEHYVVFAARVFRYTKGDAAARDEAVAYGRSVGVPEQQLDWENYTPG